MQKKLRKENLPFVLASADRGSSWQPPIGRTLELGLRRSVTSLLPHAGVLRTQGRGFARLLRCCIQSIDFLDLLPSIFLAYLARTLFLANQRIFGTYLLFSFFGLVGFAWRERERERVVKSERDLVCGKKQEGEFFVSSSCNEGKAYAPEFFFQILFFFLFLSKSG